MSTCHVTITLLLRHRIALLFDRQGTPQSIYSPLAIEAITAIYYGNGHRLSPQNM